MNGKPTKAFVLVSIAMLIAGVSAFCIGLLNAQMALNEKGYYFAILIFGLFSFVSLQKTVRDKLEGSFISKPYIIMCWVASATSIALLTIGLINAELLLSEKGFYAMAYLLSGFAAITVQKNVRDSIAVSENIESQELEKPEEVNEELLTN
ncbi:inner membrane protein YiaA [Thalassotalea euphylliae]|uniref:inner membrane protein YiaA n=1 Tax=Thalassotalea euphylliae TaxID=1655234 RepID=UPI0036357000